ncbi:AraC family transcriptional regulator [Streptomyces scopuliridis]|uniref:AraC family transcriptional regulator n=1 Tax=Streptomyces scopuliridis RB72 TaxID=1440053 RepID=A0A2T7SYD6_9ACTN|nr:helix-turn-helix domain-containing protein [Streptomyces scopuliridis]PVE07873.1 AraC family transcriptional regulator [Streptomyces scopuliridis RB72]
MAGPRRDTRGIVDAPGLFARVRFRRREPAPALRPYLEHYWLIDWDLDQPYASHVVPHPSVNVVFQRFGPGADSPAFAEVAGVGLELFTQKLAGRGRVCGVQFRPGGFRPFAPGWPVSEWTGRRVPIAEVMPATDADIAAVLGPPDAPEDARVAALDSYLLGIGPRPDPRAAHAMAVADRIRTDRTIRRVARLSEAEGVSVRSLQRLFAAYVGVGPKWVILRYRIHEALERAESETGTEVEWAELAAELGYSDQAHLVRDFTATVGVPPTAYARPPAAGRPDVRPPPYSA